MTPAADVTLRRKLARGNVLVGPGVYDALSARLCERAGFPMAFLSGYGLAAVRLGLPDVGLLTLPEVCAATREITAAVEIPLVVDGDTGYGNALNVIRTVQDVEAAGAAGLLLEDQEWPKRCGHLPGKRVIPAAAHVQKLRAALDARRNRDFLIFARTDAREPLGLEAAVARGCAYAEAGADVVFVEAPQSNAELARIGRAVPGPLMANMLEGGLTPELPVDELRRLGFQVIAHPLTALLAAARGVQTALTALRAQGSAAALRGTRLPFDALNDLVGLAEARALEERYAGDI